MSKPKGAKQRRIFITAKGHAILAALDAGTYRTATKADINRARARDARGRFTGAP